MINLEPRTLTKADPFDARFVADFHGFKFWLFGLNWYDSSDHTNFTRALEVSLGPLVLTFSFKRIFKGELV